MPAPHAPIVVVRVSWARVEPARGAYAEAELEAVALRLRELRAAGAEAVVSLHAGALPDWVLARRGWLDPGVLADWSCYVDRVAQRVGVHVARWAPFEDPFGEAAWYDGAAHAVRRTLLDAHATAYLHLARTQGAGGARPQVGVVMRAVERVAEGWRGRVERARAEAWGEEAWLRVLATGRVAPPFGLGGELPNGTPALDWIGATWGGVVTLPGGREGAGAPEARERVVARWCTLGKPIVWIGAAP